jgi:hypothetical protein
MKYRLQDEFNKIHRCVIVIIEDNIPHAWSFCLYLVFFEEIEFGFVERFKWVWILFLGERAAEYFCHTNPPIIRKLKLLRWLLARPIPAPIRVPFASDAPATPHIGPSSPNHTLSGRGDVGSPHPSRRLLAGGAPLRWFTVGLKHDEIHVTEARSCNREEDDFCVGRKTRISSGLAIVVG